MIPEETVASLTSQMADDRDRETLGVAVVSSNSAENKGVWQYFHGNWSDETCSSNATREANPPTGGWTNFPLDMSESKALLLHGCDRIRFIPKPNFFWLEQEAPSLTVKVWDTSVASSLLSPSNEAFLSSINSDPFSDTAQSLFHTVGLFSDNMAVIEAGRYGCNGVINSGLIFDPCCVCGGTGDGCEGCDGVRGSGGHYDFCDVCKGDGGCEGCDNIPFSGSRMGDCGVCVSGEVVGEVMGEEGGRRFRDCDGVCFGSGVSDECRVCIPGDSSHKYNSDM